MKQNLAWIFAAASFAAVLYSAPVHADERDATPAVASFEGTYDHQGVGCDYAAQVTFSEETDPTTDQVTYHLRLLRDDGRVWNSREFRQLNGLPWYKADIGNDATVSGRSRYSCTSPDCTLSTERKTCKGLILPRCTGWSATRQDEVVFETAAQGVTLTLATDADVFCTYVKR